MFGSLGLPEILFILVLALLIFGPRKLPEIGRTLGRSLSEFRKASTDLKRSLNAEMIEEEMRQSDPRKFLDEAASGGAPDAGATDPRPEDAAAVPRGSIPRGGDAPAEAPAAPASETVPEPEAQ